MPYRIVEDKYQTDGKSKATVVVEADQRSELERMEAKTAAVEFARTKNFPAFGISNIPQIYPVDDTGEISDAMLHGKKPVKAYRMDVDISPGRYHP